MYSSLLRVSVLFNVWPIAPEGSPWGLLISPRPLVVQASVFYKVTILARLMLELHLSS